MRKISVWRNKSLRCLRFGGGFKPVGCGNNFNKYVAVKRVARIQGAYALQQSVARNIALWP